MKLYKTVVNRLRNRKVLDLYERHGEDGDTLLHIAARNLDADELEILCRYISEHPQNNVRRDQGGALDTPINIKNRKGYTPLHWVILGNTDWTLNGHTQCLRCIQILVDAGADINAPILRVLNKTLLDECMRKPELFKEAELLLSLGARNDIKSPLGPRYIPLHQAALNFNVEGLEVLLRHMAIYNSRSEIEQAMKGAMHSMTRNVNMSPNDFGQNQYSDVQWSYRYRECFQMLVAAGADINEKDELAETLLHVAVRNSGSSDGVKFLLNTGVKIDEVDNRFQTPLHLACRDANAGILQILLEHLQQNSIPGLLDQKDANGATALFLVVVAQYSTVDKMTAYQERCMATMLYRKKKCIEMLLAAGANINESIPKYLNLPEGLTVFAYAISSRQVEIVKLFLNHQVDFPALVQDKTYLMMASDCMNLADDRLSQNISMEIFYRLLNHCDLQATNIKGETVLQYAASTLNALVLEYLLISKKDVFLGNRNSDEVCNTLNQLLLSAMKAYTLEKENISIRNNFIRTIEVLLWVGANASVMNENGETLDYILAGDFFYYHLDSHEVLDLFKRFFNYESTFIEEELTFSKKDLSEVMHCCEINYNAEFWQKIGYKTRAIQELHSLHSQGKETYSLKEIREVLKGEKMRHLHPSTQDAYFMLTTKLYERRIERLLNTIVSLEERYEIIDNHSSSLGLRS